MRWRFTSDPTSGDSEQDFFADGLTEDILTDYAREQDLLHMKEGLQKAGY